MMVGSHFWVHVANGHGGETYDYNQSLYDMAFAPPNVLAEARSGNPLAVGIITSFLMLLGYQGDRLLRGVLRLWHGLSRVANEGTVFCVLLIFVWYCVWRASASEVDSPITPRRLMPEIANRADLHPLTSAALQSCTAFTHAALGRVTSPRATLPVEFRCCPLGLPPRSTKWAFSWRPLRHTPHKWPERQWGCQRAHSSFKSF